MIFLELNGFHWRMIWYYQYCTYSSAASRLVRSSLASRILRYYPTVGSYVFVEYRQYSSNTSTYRTRTWYGWRVRPYHPYFYRYTPVIVVIRCHPSRVGNSYIIQYSMYYYYHPGTVLPVVAGSTTKYCLTQLPLRSSMYQVAHIILLYIIYYYVQKFEFFICMAQSFEQF